MKAFVSHETALLFWRLHFPFDAEIGAPVKISQVESYANKKLELLAAIPEVCWPESHPVDVLVFDERKRAWTQGFTSHIWSTPIPHGAFYRVRDMYVSSPEFVFLQMASKLSVVQLAALGCELCGTFVLLPDKSLSGSPIGNIPRRIAPLTNVAKLGAFLDQAQGARGIAKSRRALRYVCEGARSPMEALTYLLLCLPPMLGGYGLPRPELNSVINLDDDGRRLAGTRWCEGDLCWAKRKLDVEYNGIIHSDIAKMKADSGRVIALEHMGWKVIGLTSPQVLDLDQFETAAQQIAKHLRHRIKTNNLGHLPARLTLRSELGEWMALAL